MKNESKKRRPGRKLFVPITLAMLFYFLASGLAIPFPGWPNIKREAPEPCTLADQIIAANADVPIRSCPAGNGDDEISLFEDVTLSMPLPPIRSTITIEGNGHRIDGDGRFRIFEVKAGHLRINELTLTNGNDHHGGAIKVRMGGKLTLDHSAISNSSASFGGAISSERGQITLRESSLVDNEALSFGGAIYASDSSMLLQASALSGNKASRKGGAIYATASDVLIQASAINGNSAISNGGGASFIGSEVEISRSVFSQNTSRIHGGGFETGGATIAISDSIIVGNSAISRGGGVYLRRSTVTMTHVTLAKNASQYDVGGLYKDYGTLNLRNSIIANNRLIDCFALLTLEENINNLIQDGTCDPMLSGEAMFRMEDGVPTFISLDSDSPAIDAAHPDYCAEVDIQGFARPQGDACDIGAVEMLADEDTES